MVKARELVVALSTVALCMLLGASVYESVVMAPNYAGGIDALKNIRAFFVASNPASYFRALAPIAQVLLLASVVLAWRAEPAQVRWLLLAALVALLCTDVITFTFHYPRNAILFVAPLDRSSFELRDVALEWARGNYVRICLLIISAVAAFGGFYALVRRSGA